LATNQDEGMILIIKFANKALLDTPCSKFKSGERVPGSHFIRIPHGDDGIQEGAPSLLCDKII